MVSKAKLKYFASLKRKKVREAEGRFLVEGLRTCEELIASDYTVDSLFFCPARFQGSRESALINACRRLDIPVSEIDEPSLRGLTETVTSQGVIAIARTESFDYQAAIEGRPSFLLALDQIREPGNLGAIIRTACWFGVNAIMLSTGSVEFSNPKVVRSSMGACFHIPVFQNLNLASVLASLKSKGYDVLVTDSKGTQVCSNYEFHPRSVLVLGNETTGVDPSLQAEATTSLRIPQKGRGDSLNVAVAAGVILSEMSKVVACE